MEATSQADQTTLRCELGKHDLDEMLSARDKINADLQEILDRQTDSWGIKIANVEIKHVDIDVSMVRQLRYLSTLYDIAGDRSSTIVFPMPMDLVRSPFPGTGQGPQRPSAPAQAGTDDLHKRQE